MIMNITPPMKANLLRQTINIKIHNIYVAMAKKLMEKGFSDKALEGG